MLIIDVSMLMHDLNIYVFSIFMSFALGGACWLSKEVFSQKQTYDITVFLVMTVCFMFVSVLLLIPNMILNSELVDRHGLDITVFKVLTVVCIGYCAVLYSFFWCRNYMVTHMPKIQNSVLVNPYAQKYKIARFSIKLVGLVNYFVLLYLLSQACGTLLGF